MDREDQQAQDVRVEKLWQTLDTRKEGQLSLEALKNGLSNMNHPLKNADSLLHDVLKVVDTDGDGHIQYSEFRAFVEQTEKELWQLFKSIDRDQNGYLDKGELVAAVLRAGLVVPSAKLDQFFSEIDKNNDGVISFDEWRDFLLFLPAPVPNLRAVLSYYSSTVKLNAEGDVQISKDAAEGMGYFLAGAIAGVVSRTATAPLDRLKVHLIAQISVKKETVKLVKGGAPVKAAKEASRPLVEAARALWRMGGIRSLFAGNGLNVLKVMPESAIKFGSYEGSKTALAKLEGHNDPKNLKPWSQFFAAGMGGIISQFAIYPLDTLKFRMQCETVQGGLKGNALILATARNMWRTTGIRSFYRGLPMGLVGMFPYSAIDLTTFEYLKKFITNRNARTRQCSVEDASPGNVTTAGIGAVSGALGASLVYPINVLRTRLQSQGTSSHPPTYDGMWDVAVKTVKGDGVKGLFKGITPNLLKVVPAVSITYVVYDNSKRAMGLP